MNCAKEDMHDRRMAEMMKEPLMAVVKEDHHNAVNMLERLDAKYCLDVGIVCCVGR